MGVKKCVTHLGSVRNNLEVKTVKPQKVLTEFDLRKENGRI